MVIDAYPEMFVVGEDDAWTDLGNGVGTDGGNTPKLVSFENEIYWKGKFDISVIYF